MLGSFRRDEFCLGHVSRVYIGARGMRTLATRLARGLHKGVVSRRVDFDPDGFLDPLDVLKLRTQPLWRGTEGVTVLSEYTLVILDLDLDLVTLSESRFGQERPDEMG
jgi:hypothetical protein